jgi:hypothetical protein
MKRKRYTEEQIAYALRQAESGAKVVEICREDRRERADLLHLVPEVRGHGGG